jgi:hypothetical protein
MEEKIEIGNITVIEDEVEMKSSYRRKGWEGRT